MDDPREFRLKSCGWVRVREDAPCMDGLGSIFLVVSGRTGSLAREPRGKLAVSHPTPSRPLLSRLSVFRSFVKISSVSAPSLRGGRQDFGESRYGGEPVFVPKSEDAAEGEGYLIVLVCEFRPQTCSSWEYHVRGETSVKRNKTKCPGEQKIHRNIL